MEQEARVTSKGQLTIPAGVRKALGIREGDSIVFEVKDNEMSVRVARRTVSFGDYAGIWREGDGLSSGEVDDYVRDLRGREE
jgi:AbrB family looped-hinge helix DNA binding protein